MFTPVTRVPTTPARQQPMSAGATCLRRNRAGTVTFPASGGRGADRMTRKRDEPVRLTKIYTRGGDRGETSLGDGSRVSKLDPRVAAYGVVDELNAQLGVVLALAELPADLREPLERIQNELFDVGADLSVPFGGDDERLRVVAGAGRRARAALRPLQRAPPRAEELRAPGRQRSRGAAPRRADGLPPRRAARARSGCGDRDRPARAGLSEPALGPALHPRPRRERGGEEPLWRPGGSR